MKILGVIHEDKRSMVILDQTVVRFASIKGQKQPIGRRFLQPAIKSLKLERSESLKTCEVDNWQAAELIGEIDVFMSGGVGQIPSNLS